MYLFHGTHKNNLKELVPKLGRATKDSLNKSHKEGIYASDFWLLSVVHTVLNLAEIKSGKNSYWSYSLNNNILHFKCSKELFNFIKNNPNYKIYIYRISNKNFVETNGGYFTQHKKEILGKEVITFKQFLLLLKLNKDNIKKTIY